MSAVRPGHGLTRAIATHPVGAYLVILYPVSWILWMPALLGKSGLGVLSVDIPVQLSILLVSIFGLTGVAFLVTRIADGKPGTRELRRHYLHFRAGPQWYVVALAGAPTLLALVGFLTHGTGALGSFGRHALEIPTLYLLTLIVIAILISVWEEGGWMSFVTTRLQPRLGPVWASVAVAPLFGLIHFPLFFITGGLIDNARPQGIHILEYALYLVVLFSVPVRILITWVFNATGGSLPIVALLHASIDTTASGAVLTAFYPGTDGRLLYVGLAAAALAVVIATRGRLAYRLISDPTQQVPASSPAPVTG